MLRKILASAIVCLISAGAAFAQTGSLSGTVTDAKSGETLVGANVYIPELQKGAPTNAEGHYKISNIPTGSYTVRVTYIGFKKVTQTVDISAGSNTADFSMQAGMALNEMVVTGALGEQQDINSVTFASQEVDAEQLNVTQDANIKTSLAGKVAGIQIAGQAGSKLGEAGDIRIRGAISLTSTTSEPLYVVDGVPGVDPNTIDMNNVKDVNVLKGPNATALYGQRGDSGVIIITSKGSGASGVSVELNESLTFQKVAYLPEYQNEYGQGYNGQGEWTTFHYKPGVDPEYFKPMDGVEYIFNSYADESWGPKLDGHEYGAWYNWFPDSPYYGETSTFTPQPNNVYNFYDVGSSNKANFAINYSKENYSARVSYTNLSQQGIIPGSNLQKHYMQGKFDYDVTDAFNVGVDFAYTIEDIDGNFADGYSGANMTSGSFNQWFGRQLDINKLRNLQNLKTPEGYQTNWNWWGPGTNPFGYRYASTVANNGFKKPAFWFNPFTWQNGYDMKQDNNNLLINLDASYQLSDNWEIQARASRSKDDDDYRRELPYTFQQSSDPTGSLFNYWMNSFGQEKINRRENNYNARVNYENNFDDWSVDAIAGSEFRDQTYNYFGAFMDPNNYQSGGLVIPNVYQYSNSRERIVPDEHNWHKQVFSMFARANFGYKDMLYLNGSYRQDWSSALPDGNNGYGYPSVGASFVFSELLDSDILSYGKVRVGWAQVGSDVDAERILTTYALSEDPFSNPVTGQSIPKLYTDATKVDPNIKPAINSSYEIGTDLRFFKDKLGLSVTYYDETKKDEIISVSLSTATGRTGYLTNAGETERRGVEVQLDATPVQTRDFQWSTTFNWARNRTTVNELPQGLTSYTVNNTTSAFGFVNIEQVKGEEYGQIHGTAIARNDEGTPIFQLNADGNPTGNYKLEQNHNFGSYLPDWTGGWLNQFTYKGIGLQATIDYQKGGQFFSLSQQWATSDGLLEETAGTNDKGNLKRDAVDDGGGVHIQGVGTDGNAVDTYVNTHDYYHQFADNYVADPYVIGADYIKLRELSLSYTLPKSIIGGFLNSARVSLVARNLWMIAVAGDNKHNWDPSELARDFGEDGQLPGTRSYGFNINVTF